MKQFNFNGRSSFAGDQTGNWRARVASLVAEKSGSKARDPSRATSNRTQVEANQNVQRIFGWLRQKLGFSGLSNPHALDERHFVAIAGHIRAKRKAGEIGPAMAAGYATYTRHLARWIGKAHMVLVFNEALGKDVCKRTLITERDKSWEAAKVDIDKKIIEVAKIERWVGLALWCQHNFGHRKNEALMFQPLDDIRPVHVSADTAQYDKKGRLVKRDMTELHWSEWVAGVDIAIVRGTKGKRPRVVNIAADNDVAKQAAYTILQEMRNFGDRDSFGPPHFTLKQNASRYDRVLQYCGITQKDLGITGHGLRAGFAITMLEGYDITPTVRGGDGQHADPVKQRQAYKATTEAMGHGRISVIGAYAGSTTPQAAARQKKARERQALLAGRAQGPSAPEKMLGLVTQNDSEPFNVPQNEAMTPTSPAKSNHD